MKLTTPNELIKEFNDRKDIIEKEVARIFNDRLKKHWISGNFSEPFKITEYDIEKLFSGNKITVKNVVDVLTEKGFLVERVQIEEIYSQYNESFVRKEKGLKISIRESD